MFTIEIQQEIAEVCFQVKAKVCRKIKSSFAASLRESFLQFEAIFGCKFESRFASNHDQLVFKSSVECPSKN
jgi:hypothetical protein